MKNLISNNVIIICTRILWYHFFINIAIINRENIAIFLTINYNNTKIVFKRSIKTKNILYAKDIIWLYRHPELLRYVPGTYLNVDHTETFQERPILVMSVSHCMVIAHAHGILTNLRRDIFPFKFLVSRMKSRIQNSTTVGVRVYVLCLSRIQKTSLLRCMAEVRGTWYIMDAYAWDTTQSNLHLSATATD